MPQPLRGARANKKMRYSCDSTSSTNSAADNGLHTLSSISFCSCCSSICLSNQCIFLLLSNRLTLAHKPLNPAQPGRACGLIYLPIGVLDSPVERQVKMINHPVTSVRTCDIKQSVSFVCLCVRYIIVFEVFHCPIPFKKPRPWGGCGPSRLRCDIWC